MNNTAWVLEVYPKNKTNDEEVIAYILVQVFDSVRFIGIRNEDAELVIKFSHIKPYSFQSLHTSKTWGASKKFDGVRISNGGVFLDLGERLNGFGIGTFLMTQAVKWVKQWPDEKVKPIMLYNSDSINFYKKFGLTFSRYNRTEKIYSKSILANGLIEPELPENISVITLEQFLKNQQREVFECESKNQTLKNRVKNYRNILERAERAPMLFALIRVWWKYRDWLLLFAIISFLVFLSCFK